MTSTMTQVSISIIDLHIGFILLMVNVTLLLFVVILRELLCAYDINLTRTWGRTLNIFIFALTFPFGINTLILFYRIVDIGGL